MHTPLGECKRVQRCAQQAMAVVVVRAGTGEPVINVDGPEPAPG
jgi:hypothetical protein